MHHALGNMLNTKSLVNVSLVGKPSVPMASQPYIPPLKTFDDLRSVLATPRARWHPPYVCDVLGAYIKPRLLRPWRLRRQPVLERDLSYLECEFPEFAAEFRAIRKTYRLRPLITSHSAAHHTSPHPLLGAHALRRAAHWDVDPSAPPAYEQADPEPEATMILEMRLVAEREEQERAAKEARLERSRQRRARRVSMYVLEREMERERQEREGPLPALEFPRLEFIWDDNSPSSSNAACCGGRERPLSMWV